MQREEDQIKPKSLSNFFIWDQETWSSWNYGWKFSRELQAEKDALEIFKGLLTFWGLHGGSDDKESACNAGDPGSVPGLGRSPGEGNGYPLQYSCLENSMDKGVWQATVHDVAKSWIQLSD